MRFDKIRGRSIGPFKSIDVDISAISGQLVAVCGPNGAGKTTLLELLSGALFRECPTRGSLTSLATARDSFVEVVACNGAPYTVRQTIDGLAGKGETLILDASGTPQTDSGKVRDGDRWIASHFPRPEVLYSSSIAVQGRRGFLDLSKTERRQVLASVVGIERYEQMAERARERAKGAKASIEVLRGRLSDLDTPDMEDLRAGVVGAQAQADRAAEAARGARVALERARAAAGDAVRAAELAEQRRAAQARQVAAKAAVDGIEVKLRNNRAVLSEGDAIRAAVLRAAELADATEIARTAVASARALLAEAAAADREAQAVLKRADADASAANLRVGAAKRRLMDRDVVRAAGARADALRVQEQEHAACNANRERESSDLEMLVLRGKDQRIEGLRSAVEQIEAGDDDAPLAAWAHSARVADDVLAARAADAPALLAATRQMLVVGRSVHEKCRADLRDAERLAARSGEIAQAEADLVAASADYEAASLRQFDACAVFTDLVRALATSIEHASIAQANFDAVTAELKGLDGMLAKRAPLASAQARIEELESLLGPARDTLQAADAELASLPVVTAEPVDIARHEGDVTRAETTEHSARAGLTRAQDAVTKAGEVLIKRVVLQGELSAAEGELSDWTRLVQDLGRDGLQALELDAALPELNEIANNLLHSTHGSRFTVEIRTDRLSADGKRTVEDLEVRVIDCVKGRDDLAETYSGGELVLVGSALSFALTMLSCRANGIEKPTILLDEAGAALDPENGRAWIAMLRLAARQISASKVFYVSHSLEQQELADARLRVHDGGVHVE